MRILAITLTLILLVVGGYTFYWFKKADEFKAAAVQIIADKNTQAKPLTKDGTLIHYDQIVMSGYPFQMQVNIIKPVLDVPASALLQYYAKSAAQTDTATKANLILEISYDDKISLASNLWANQFTFTLSGASTIKPIASNEAKRALLSTMSAPAVCHLAIENNNDGTPWTLPQSLGDAKNVLKIFRAADCELQGLTSKYADTGEVLSTSDELSLAASSRPVDPQNYRIAFTLDAQNVKATAAYDILLNSYATLFYDVLGTPQDQRQTDINLSQYGAQNSKIDVSYEGPVEKKDMLDPNANLNFDIAALDFKNALYNTTNKVHFSTAVHSDRRESILRVNSSFTSTEAYEQILARQLTKAFADMAKTPNPDMKFTTELAALNKPDVLAADFIPKLHALGGIKFNADINASNDKTKGILDDSEVLITSLDLTADKYGIKIKGNGKSTAGALPTGEVFATCLTCDDMVDGIGAYATTIDSLLATVREGQQRYVPQALIDGTKQFLHALNEQAANQNTKDVVIHLAADGKGGATISGKQIMEVLGLYNTDIGQYIANNEQPAAPQILKPDTMRKNKKSAQ